MKNIIFIKQETYNDTLVGPQLLRMLDKSVFLDGEWCCYSNHVSYNDITFNMTLDNMVYLINNYILAQQFDNIIIGWHFEDNEVIKNIIKHLNAENWHITIFELTNTNNLDGIENFELMNKEYHTDYYNLDNSKMLKVSEIDTTGISAFKIAKVIEEILNK